jgi:hypothetical protein
MLGSLTTPGWVATRDGVAIHVAFLYANSVGTRVWILSRLNGQPARTPADASPCPSRNTTHGSGAM